MNTRFSASSLAIATLLAAVAVSAQQKTITVAQVPPVPPDNTTRSSTPSISLTVPDPFAEMFAALKAATPDKREGLSNIQTRMDQVIDTQISQWKSAGYNVTLAADERLDTATEDFAEKLRQLSFTSEETWDTAKHNAELALRTAQAAYIEIITNPVRD